MYYGKLFKAYRTRYGVTEDFLHNTLSSMTCAELRNMAARMRRDMPILMQDSNTLRKAELKTIVWNELVRIYKGEV